MMFGSYSGDIEPDPYWLGQQPSKPLPEQLPAPSVGFDGSWGPNELEPTSDPPRPTAESERLLHELGLLVEQVDARHRLGIVLVDLHTQLKRLRPGGNWTSIEMEAAAAAKTAIATAIDLLATLEDQKYPHTG